MGPTYFIQELRDESLRIFLLYLTVLDCILNERMTVDDKLFVEPSLIMRLGSSSTAKLLKHSTLGEAINCQQPTGGNTSVGTAIIPIFCAACDFIFPET
jgi:hypothetical protein